MWTPQCSGSNTLFFCFFFTTKYRVVRKRSTKRIKYSRNLFGKKMQIKAVCYRIIIIKLILFRLSAKRNQSMDRGVKSLAIKGKILLPQKSL